MPFDNTRAKALAAVSEAQADVKGLEADLSAAQTKLKLAQAGDSAVDTVSSVPVVGDATEFLRKRTDAQVASAQADVDRITAELATAQTKLKWAQRALDTVDNVNATVSDLQDSAREALADDGSGYSAPTADGAADDAASSARDAAQPGDAKA